MTSSDPLPTHPVSGQYLSDWLVLGGFEDEDWTQDFLADTGGETGVHPQEGEAIDTADGAASPGLAMRYRARRLT